MVNESNGTTLLGVCNSKYFIASIEAHHYVVKGKLMADGGQPDTPLYAGYTRFGNGKTLWAQVPETYAELVTDYKAGKKIGIWELKNIKKTVEPDTTTQAWYREHTIWGTRGKNGDQPLKYIRLDMADTDHLEAILATQPQISQVTRRLIETVLKERDTPKTQLATELLDI